MRIYVSNKIAYGIGTVKGYAWDDFLKDMITKAIRAIFKSFDVIKVDRNYQVSSFKFFIGNNQIHT